LHRKPSAEVFNREVETMAPKTAVKEERWAAVQCAYCRGKGKDPFKVPHSKSNCCVCGGKGTVRVQEPYRVCAFCQGTGIHPHRRLTCTACKGKGVVAITEPVQTCPSCGGQGLAESEFDLPCVTCSGKGVVSA
jgi:RecJ-like exonuclease